MLELARVRQRLLRQAYLFDEPKTYVAGVEDALGAVEEELGQATSAHMIDLTQDEPRMPAAST